MTLLLVRMSLAAQYHPLATARWRRGHFWRRPNAQFDTDLPKQMAGLADESCDKKRIQI